MITNRLLPLRAILASALAVVSTGAVSAPAAWPAATTEARASVPGQLSGSGITASDGTESGGTVNVSFAPSASSLSPDGSMTYSVVVENNTAEDLPSGTASITTARAQLESRAELSDWLDGETDSAEHEAASVAIPPIDAGDSFTSSPVSVTVESLAIGADAGTYPVQLTYTADDTTADDRSTVVVSPTDETASAPVAVVIPITIPSGSAGIIDADALEVYTGPSGILTKQLSAVLGRQVAIGIDPMIIASIRALGNAAPETAVTWLERLERAPNEIFPLQYGDADVTVQTQAGRESLLTPTSLAWTLDPANFTPEEGENDGEEETPSPGDGTDQPTPPATEPTISGSTSPAPTPTSTPTPDDPADDPLPTLDELLAWDYTRTNIAWPGSGTVVAADLPALTASGTTATIVSSGNVTFGDADRSPWAAAGDAALLVTDSAASAALNRAAKATEPLEHAAALADLAAQLTLARSESDAPLLLGFDRGWKGTESHLLDTLTALEAMPGVVGTAFGSLSAGIATPVALVDSPQPQERISVAAQLLNREDEVERFATVAEDPNLVVGRQQADLMALLSVSWQEQPGEWVGAVTTRNEQTTALLNAVGISSTTPVNMIANQTNIRVPVRNDLTQPVTVVLQVSPTNPRLDIDAPDAQVIPAQSVETVSIPVVAQLGNGEVTLRLQLYSADHVPIGSTALLPVNVRAEWETIGVIALAVIVVVLFVGGLIRTILKRRAQKARAAEVDGPPKARPDATGPSPVDDASGASAPPAGDAEQDPAPGSGTEAERDG